MTDALFAEGMAYAEENFLNQQAEHLKLDKSLIRQRFNLDDKKVLDFGCGMGGMTLWYATNWKCSVHGFDIDSHHIKIAKSLQEKHSVKNVVFEKRNILDNPTKEKYDLIFMNDVAEHISFPILEKILAQLAKSLSSDGKLFVTFPPWRSPYASHLNHVIKIPWVQFLPKSVLYKLIDKNNHSIVGELEGDLKSAYEGLNHLTYSKLKKICNSAGLKETYRKSHCFLNKLPGMKDKNLSFFPFDFLITKEFLELKSA